MARGSAGLAGVGASWVIRWSALFMTVKPETSSSSEILPSPLASQVTTVVGNWETLANTGSVVQAAVISSWVT